ncbi:hypothetical protein FQA39_LY15410 [Lamprigera yunnana]|nr:hypothetical protein FQA39_LY15410 [Lamprigera yunnana]
MASTCVITSVDYDEDAVKPVIVNFENGPIEPGQEKNLSCRLYTNEQKELLVAAATENMLYSGAVKPKDMYNTFIAVTNKKKTKMRLIAVDTATLAPRFTESNIVNQMVDNVDSSNVSQLNKVFGSKKAKRIAEQKERMKVDIEMVKEELKETVKDIKIEQKDLEVLKVNENELGYLPHINRDAKSVEDIYNVNDIVSSNVLSTMSNASEKILGEEAELDPDTSDFVKCHIQNIMKSDGPNKMERVQLLLYIDSMFKFLAKPAKQLTTKALKLCPYSDMVQDKILDNYTTRSGRNRLRPNSMRDKCICAILVLSIIACRYSLDLELISKELKQSLKKMKEISKVLGFHVNKDTASLSLPLPPIMKTFTSKKRKK